MKRVFLDLEGTIIDMWDNPILINVDKIRNFLVKCEVSEIEIFSFAIWDKDDVNAFGDIKESLEKNLCVNIKTTHPLDDVSKIVNKFNRFQLKTIETASLWGKARSFEDFIDATHENSHCILIDDIVPLKRIENKDTGNIIELINVDSL